ncbi:right-handed parallel beta-helix repeat-containing protein [Geodermatophilus sp. SYSU D00079]
MTKPASPAGAPVDAAAATGAASASDDVPRSRAVGRRGLVTGGLLVGAAAVGGFAVAPRGDRAAVAAAGPAGAVVLAGPGVDPSGHGDSTAGLQALVDAAPEGAWLWLPAGVFLVEGLVLRAGQMLTGPSARAYTGGAAAGARLRALRAEQTAPVLTVGEFGRVADVAVEGRGQGQPAVRPAGVGAVLERVTMVGGSVGYDAAYVSGSVLSECQVHENGIGIKDLVDSVVQGSAINANSGDGISLGPGANDNSFLGNKVEWNEGHGIHALQALHNVVLGGVLDRNGRTGARFVECQHTVLVGAVLRRNGRLAEQAPEDDCHVFQRDCTALVVTGVVTNAGRDDDGASGYRSPAVAIREEGGTDVGYTGNDLTGRTSPVAIARGAAATRASTALNLGVGGVQDVSGTRVRVATGEVSLDPGATAAVTVDLDGLPTGTLGSTYRLGLVARDPDTGERAVAEALLLVSRDDGDARVQLGPVENRIGAGFGAAEGQLRLTVTASADGAVLTVGVQNTRDRAARVGVELA